MQIKLTKKQWEDVGMEAGWIKTAQFDFNSIGKRWAKHIEEEWKLLTEMGHLPTRLHNLKSPMQVLVNHSMGTVVDADEGLRSDLINLIKDIEELDSAIALADEATTNFIRKHKTVMDDLLPRIASLKDKQKKMQLRPAR